MRLIKITPIIKIRVKEMILDLFPEYKYVKVKKTGLVSLKKNRWSLRRETLSLTDLAISVIPKRIAKRAKEDNKGNEYLNVFNSYISSMVYMSIYDCHFDIIEYIWNKYVELCLEIPTILIDVEDLDMLDVSYNRPIALSFNKNRYFHGIVRDISPKKLPTYKKDSVVSKINKLKKKYL